MPTPTPTAAPRGVGRFALPSTLVLSMACGIFVISCVGVLTPFLVDDLDLTTVELGTLLTAAYLAAAVTSLVTGRVADVVGGPRLLLLLYVCSAGSIVCLVVAPSYGVLLFGMGLAGLALAASNPATNELVAANVEMGNRGTLVGIKQSGPTIAWILASTSMPTLAVAFGWRRALLTGLVLTAAGAVVTRAALKGSVARAPRLERVRGPIGNGITRIVTFAFLMSTGSAAVTAYLVLYATERCRMSATAAAAILAVVNTASALARVGAGRLADRRPNMWPSLRLQAMVASASMATIALGTRSTLALWLAAPLLGAASGAWATTVMVATVTRFGDGQSGRASGTVVFGGHAGLLASPIAFGTLVEATDSYEVAWLAVAACFVAAALLATRSDRRERSIPSIVYNDLELDG